MNSANATEQEMKYLIDKYSEDNINQLFSTGLLSHPFLASGPRQHMFSVHYQQHIMLKDPETPRCFTGWENQFGKYLNSFYKADRRFEVIAKIIRHSSFPQILILLLWDSIGDPQGNGSSYACFEGGIFSVCGYISWLLDVP